MFMFVVGASLLGLVPVGYSLISMYDPSVGWAESSSDYKMLWVVVLILLLTFAAMFLLLYNLKIEIKANADTIDARMIPLMRSYRVTHLSDVKSLEIIKIDGFMKYGGVGLKKNFGGMTSYTLTGDGHALRIKMKNKKELHVQISKLEKWKRYISDFKSQTS